MSACLGIKEAVEQMSLDMADASVDYVDGIIYGQHRALAISASMRQVKSDVPCVVLPDDGRFIDVLGRKMGSEQVVSFKMSTFDYLQLGTDLGW